MVFMKQIILIFELFMAYLGIVILSAIAGLLLSLTPAVAAVYYISASIVFVGFVIVTARFLREIQLLTQNPST